MKGVVIYYSKYGNNEKTARAVHEGLKEAGQEADMINAKKTKGLGKGLDFLVIGSPTRFGLASRPIKKFIKMNIGREWAGKPFAAFGTCLQKACEKEEGTAAKDIHEQLEKLGLKPLSPPLDAPVKDMKGPLEEGTETRARDFGKDIGSRLSL